METATNFEAEALSADQYDAVADAVVALIKQWKRPTVYVDYADRFDEEDVETYLREGYYALSDAFYDRLAYTDVEHSSAYEVAQEAVHEVTCGIGFDDWQLDEKLKYEALDAAFDYADNGDPVTDILRQTPAMWAGVPAPQYGERAVAVVRTDDFEALAPLEGEDAKRIRLVPRDGRYVFVLNPDCQAPDTCRGDEVCYACECDSLDVREPVEVVLEADAPAELYHSVCDGVYGLAPSAYLADVEVID